MAGLQISARHVFARLPSMARSLPRELAPTAAIVTQPQHRCYQTPLKDVDFVINETYDIQKHYAALEKQNGPTTDAETVSFMVEAMGKFGEEVLAPLNEGADTVGCVQEGPHEVITPPGFKDAYNQFVEGGWQGLSYAEKWGGQGLPQSLSILTSEIVATANWTWGMFPGLSRGCINTVLSHGTDAIKKKYIPKLVTGEWTGTMCLTEPHCGSDLAQVRTKAIPQPDGTYKITGTKIFISCGEHDMAGNIMHCVLARLPGAPEGTRGISLFLVPKHKVNDVGECSKDYNNVNVGRIEEKMGCHGSPTCELIFDGAEGYLLGTENRGLNHMFTFINTSRLGTAIQGLAASELVLHTRTHFGMPKTGTKNPDKPADAIIEHPDVRRMILSMKVNRLIKKHPVCICRGFIDTFKDL